MSYWCGGAFLLHFFGQNQPVFARGRNIRLVQTKVLTTAKLQRKQDKKSAVASA
jgi:hypothetical protein